MISEVKKDTHWLDQQSVLKRIESIKGRKSGMPSSINSYMEASLYKALEPVLYKNGHYKLNKFIEEN